MYKNLKPVQNIFSLAVYPLAAAEALFFRIYFQGKEEGEQEQWEKG